MGGWGGPQTQTWVSAGRMGPGMGWLVPAVCRALSPSSALEGPSLHPTPSSPSCRAAPPGPGRKKGSPLLGQHICYPPGASEEAALGAETVKCQLWGFRTRLAGLGGGHPQPGLGFLTWGTRLGGIGRIIRENLGSHGLTGGGLGRQLHGVGVGRSGQEAQSCDPGISGALPRFLASLRLVHSGPLCGRPGLAYPPSQRPMPAPPVVRTG